MRRRSTIRIAVAMLVASALLQGCGDDEAALTDPSHLHTVASVQMERTTLSLEEGETFQLSAAPTCEAKHEMEVAWRSTDPAVAAVDDDGLITAVYEGEADVLAEVEVGDGTVREAAAVRVDRDGVVVERDGATVACADGAVVLEVPEGAVEEAAKITVRPSPDDVAAEKPGLVRNTAYHSRPEGFRFRSEARLTLRYRASEVPLGADVDRLRLFHRTGDGWTEVTESRVDTELNAVTGPVAAFSHYAVVEPELTPADRILVEGANREPLMIGPTLQLTPRLLDADGDEVDRPVQWSSSDAIVATVDENGLVTGRNHGDVTVTAAAEGLTGCTGVSVRGEPTAGQGNNLTHHTWDTHSMIRVEHVLYAAGAVPMQGYEMTWLYGEGPDEMQGTDGTLYEAVPTVYSVAPRLKIEKLEGMEPGDAPGAPVCTLFDGAIHEGLGTEGPDTIPPRSTARGRSSTAST